MAALTDRTVVVTGASRGLGRSMAIALSEAGATVVLVSRSRDPLETVATECPGETLVAPTDVRDEDDVDDVVSSTLDAFGRLDAVVNNAGVGMLTLAGERRAVVDVTKEQWDAILETNLTGVFLFTKAALPHLIERGSGNVINVSSGLGRRTEARWAPYVASKWGLEGFTGSIAAEVEADGVNVNAVDPGGRVETKFWEQAEGDLLDPTVMDDAIVALAAQGPAGVTGESMNAADWEQRLE